MSEKKDSLVQRIADSAFMAKLEEVSMKLSGSDLFSAISGGMGGTMGLIMCGAVFQIITIAGTSLLGWTTDSTIYNFFYTPYQYTMGILAFFMSFNLANAYGRKKGMNGIMCGITSIVIFFLVCCPLQQATLADGSTITAINTANMGSGSIFCAMAIGLTCVNIMKFVQDKNWTIKLPESVPEGIGASFQAMIPTLFCIVIWYTPAWLVATFTGTTLATMITYVLSIPFGLLCNDFGIFFVLLFGQIFWFFGIHGTSVMFIAMLTPLYAAYGANAQLAMAGQPLQYSPIFVWMSAMSVCGGTGNTLPLVVMGLKSKSKTIKAVCKAALVPNICNINEPVVFGFPLMYNATMMIPFLFNPVIVGILFMIGFKTGLIALPQVLIMTTLPVFLSSFVSTLDWRNVIFAMAMFPLIWLMYYPFFKVYEAQMVKQEAEEAEEDEE